MSDSPTTPGTTAGRDQIVNDASTNARPKPLGRWSLTPSLSIGVFLIVAMFTLDSSGSSRIGLALIAGVVLGPVVSYLLYAHWPRRSAGDRNEP